MNEPLELLLLGELIEVGTPRPGAIGIANGRIPVRIKTPAASSIFAAVAASKRKNIRPGR